jgi:hypothetical protein
VRKRPVEIRIDSLALPAGSAAEGRAIAATVAEALARADPRRGDAIPNVDVEAGGGSDFGARVGAELRRTVER